MTKQEQISKDCFANKVRASQTVLRHFRNISSSIAGINLLNM